MTASVSIDPAVRREVQSDYFRYLLPTLIGQIAHSFYCMADVFFVGAAVGSDGLAALMLFSVLWGETGIWLALFAAEFTTYAVFTPVRSKMDRPLNQAPALRPALR